MPAYIPLVGFVLKDCDPYVPMRTGNLVGSGTRATRLGSGKVQYNAGYARAVYYARGRNFSKQKHPKATALWFEKAKAARLAHWREGVNRILKSR